MMSVFLAVVAIPILVAAVAVARNRVPLRAPPGVLPRMVRYLTANVAETATASPWPELRPMRCTGDPVQARLAVLATMRELGWAVAPAEPGTPLCVAVASTPLFRFRDDITVRVEPDAGGHACLWIRSASRIGRADFGANLGHVLRLQRALVDRGAIAPGV